MRKQLVITTFAKTKENSNGKTLNFSITQMEGKARAQAFDFGRCQTSGQDLAPKGVRKKMLQGCMLYQLRKKRCLGKHIRR